MGGRAGRRPGEWMGSYGFAHSCRCCWSLCHWAVLGATSCPPCHPTTLLLLQLDRASHLLACILAARTLTLSPLRSFLVCRPGLCECLGAPDGVWAGSAHSFSSGGAQGQQLQAAVLERRRDLLRTLFCPHPPPSALLSAARASALCWACTAPSASMELAPSLARLMAALAPGVCPCWAQVHPQEPRRHIGSGARGSGSLLRGGAGEGP